MKYNCLIVDDEPLARELVELHVSKLPEFTIVATCENAIQALPYINNDKIDLVFLDIQMPVILGIDFIKSVRVFPPVIITTAFREYALEGYDLDIVDYLLKPITFERFLKAIEKFKRVFNSTDKSYIGQGENSSIRFIKSGAKQLRIDFSEVVLIESFKDYIVIHFKDKKELKIKFSISAIESLLTNDFIRIHRSFIINKKVVSSFTKNEVWVMERRFPIGDSFKKAWDTFLSQL